MVRSNPTLKGRFLFYSFFLRDIMFTCPVSNTLTTSLPLLLTLTCLTPPSPLSFLLSLSLTVDVVLRSKGGADQGGDAALVQLAVARAIKSSRALSWSLLCTKRTSLMVSLSNPISPNRDINCRNCRA